MPKESSYFKISNLSDKHDLKQIKKEIGAMSGVISVSVNLEKSGVAVDYDNTGVLPGRIESRLNSLGFDIYKEKTEEHLM